MYFLNLCQKNFLILINSNDNKFIDPNNNQAKRV